MSSETPPVPPEVLTASSDVLAFFYTEVARLLAGLRDDVATLARRAERTACAVREDGIDASEQERVDFHVACDLTGGASELTFRLVITVDPR